MSNSLYELGFKKKISKKRMKNHPLLLYLIYPNKTNMKNIKKKLQTYCDRINEILDNSGYGEVYLIVNQVLKDIKFVVSDDLTEHQGIVIRYSNEEKENEW